MRFTNLLFVTLLTTISVQAQQVETLVTGPSTFNDGLVLDSKGNIYASRYYSNTVTKIVRDGTTSIFASGFSDPNGMVMDANDTLYVTSASGNRIDKIAPDGTKSILISGIENPTSLVFDADSNLLVTQYQLSRISKIDSAGIVTSFMTGQGLNGPVGMNYDEAGNLYIGNFNDGKILKRTPEGDVSVIGDIPGWMGFSTYSNGYIYATGFQQHKIYRIATDGSEQIVYAGTGGSGNKDGELDEATFNGPNGIVASVTGDTLFISDFESRSLRMITGVLSNSTNSEIERSEPENFNLHQNFPNPFNPSTTINFDVNRASDVIISVFDLNGRIILELVNAFYNSGSYSVDFDATNLASGTYIYEMRSPDYVKIKTFTLIK